MSSSSDKQYYVELTRHSLHAVRAAGPVIEFIRGCPLDQKAAVEELLAAWTTGPGITATATVSPARTHWHLSTAAEAPRHRTVEALHAFASALPHGFEGALEHVVCQSADGARITGPGDARWLLGVTPADGLAEVSTALTDKQISLSRRESATLSRIAAAGAAVRENQAPSIALLEFGLERSHLFLIAGRGVEAVVPCTAGLDELFTRVQEALGLKLRGAAARLFFNDTYDFTAPAPRIAAALAPALKTAFAALPASASGVSPVFGCIGLTSKQDWFVRELASAVGVTPWTPDVAKLAARWKLQLPASADAALSSDSVGVLQLAAAQARADAAWHGAWRSPKSAPAAAATPPASAPAAKPAPSAPKSPSPASSGGGGGGGVAAAVEAVASVGSPRAVVLEEAPAAAPAAVALATRPETKPAAVLAPAAPAAAAKPAAKAVVASPRKSEKAAATTAVAAPPKHPSVIAPAAPPPAPTPVTAPAAAAPAQPAPAPRKRNLGLLIGVAAGLVCAALAGKFYLDARSAQTAAEQEKIVAAGQLKLAAARAQAIEAQAKTESERLRREAEAARESAVALARQQAEQQTRATITAEMNAERIAKSPGILIVTTSPAGAAVSIDGGPARTAPLSLNDILPGSHRVAISLPGYESVELTADIRGTQTTDLGLIPLERATGTLSVASAPAGVNFTVRTRTGSEVIRHGQTPAQFDDLAPGDYVVSYAQPGWHEQAENVSVAKRAVAEVTTTFKSGVVVLTSSPSGAAVKQGGTVLGTTPFTLGDVAPQHVSYELALPGFDVATVSGDVVEGQKLELNASLLSVDRTAASGEVATPPEPYETPAPDVGLKSGNQPQRINVSFIVRRDGTLRDIQVLGNVDKDVARRCLVAVAKWKFHPGQARDGRPLNVRVTLPINIVAD